jgi:hypothetical protein
VGVMNNSAGDDANLGVIEMKNPLKIGERD